MPVDCDAKALADGGANVLAIGGGNLLSAGATGMLATDRDDMPSSVSRLIFDGGTGGDGHGIGMFTSGVVVTFSGCTAARAVSVGGAMSTGGRICADDGIFASDPMFCCDSTSLGPTVCGFLDVRDAQTTIAACIPAWMSRRFATIRNPSC